MASLPTLSPRLVGAATTCCNTPARTSWLRLIGRRSPASMDQRSRAISMTSSRSCFSGTRQFISELHPIDKQTYVLEGPERVHMSKVNPNIYKADQYYSDATTLYEGFQRGKRISNDGPLLGSRLGDDQPFKWISFSEVEERAILFGSGLVALGNQPGETTVIGIFSQNRVEWALTDVACLQYSMVSAPFFNTIDIRASGYIIGQTNMTTIVCDTMEKAERLRTNPTAAHCLKNVVVMDLPIEGIGEQRALFEAEGIKLMSFGEVMELGTKNVVDRVLPTPDTVSTLIYTSGTTGLPKGVPLTHKNHIANHAYAWQTLSDDCAPNHKDCHLSYLPLPHTYERSALNICFLTGLQAGFFQGDPLKLVDDINALKPTALGGVPRVFNRIYDRVMTMVNASSPTRRAIFNFAYQQKLRAVNRGYTGRDTLWDQLVFKTIQARFGGNINMMCSAAAPLAPEIPEFMRVTVGCSFFEAYGQTEATSCITHTVLHDHAPGHVGIPGGDSMIKLVDAPELDYYAENDEGEVCVKGSHIFSGYFQDPEKTREVLDADGWLHTGDIGKWNKNGTLSILDRKKSIFKLSQGVYIAPEKIENVYLREPLIAQAFVTGNSQRNSLVGIVVPDREELRTFAKSQNIPGTFEDLCRNEQVKSAIFSRLAKHGQAGGLAGFEQVKGIHIHADAFSENNGLLTPTFKNKRYEMEKVFAEEIDEMYSEIK